MCSSTRFPEDIPLRGIKTNAILKALIILFTPFGLPKSTQSDQGTNSMTHAFQQVVNQLGIKQYKSSAYQNQLGIKQYKSSAYNNLDLIK